MTGTEHRPSALVLVDVVDAFFRPGSGAYYPESTEVLPALRALLSAARERRTLVVHAVERHYPGLDDFEWRKLPQHCIIGEADAAYVDGFEPRGEREVEVPKRRYSAFYATDLELLLREQGIEQVVLAGVKTNVCVRATAQDAFAGGFETWVVRDATNSNRPHLAEASLEDIDRYLGRVVDLDEGIAAL